MTVLVTAASRHGSTAEIAQALADGLARRGVAVEVRDPRDVPDGAGHDAVVLGSAVYAGRWCRDARALAARLAASPSPPPVWLFSSGPVGDPPRPVEDPPDAAVVTALTSAVAHRTLSGRLDRRRLGPLERAVVRVVRAVDGDVRDWGAVDAYAAEIAAAVSRAPAPA